MHREVEGLGGKIKTGGNNGKMKQVCEVSDAISFRAVLQVFAAIYFHYQRFVLLNLILCSWCQFCSYVPGSQDICISYFILEMYFESV